MSEAAEKKRSEAQTSLPLETLPAGSVAAGSAAPTPPPLRVAEPARPDASPKESEMSETKPAEAKPTSEAKAAAVPTPPPVKPAAEAAPTPAKPVEATPTPTKPPEAKPAAEAKPAPAKPTETKPAAEAKPAPAKPTETKPAPAKPPEAKPAAEAKPAPAKPAEPKPAEPKPAAPKPAAEAKAAPAAPAKPAATVASPMLESATSPDDQRQKAQDTVAQLRKRRSRALFLKLALFVLLPTLVMTGYAAFIASDSYESVAMFSIQSADNTSGIAMEGLIGLAGASPSGRDTLAAREYVLSREMLGVLDERMNLLQKYRSPRVDFFSRLPADASIEDAYEYYLTKVRVGYDSNSGVLTLRVRAFTTEDAHQAVATILSACEDKVNMMSERSRQDSIRFAEDELKKAEARLTRSRTELIALQQERGEFSPEHTAQAAMSIRTQLEGELANARAEYATLRSYMADNSPQVIAARQRVQSLAGQAQSESKRLVAPDAEGLNSSLVEFERVLVEKEFATHAYQSALTSLELARADAARKHRYLATIADASLPDEAQYPRRSILVLTTFLLCLVLFGIGTLGWAAIKEHARLS